MSLAACVRAIPYKKMKDYVMTFTRLEPVRKAERCHWCRPHKKVNERAESDKHAQAIAQAWITLFQTQYADDEVRFEVTIVRLERV